MNIEAVEGQRKALVLYLPHHLVNHKRKNCMGFKCSFECNGATSVNSSFHPTLDTSLLGVLLELLSMRWWCRWYVSSNPPFARRQTSCWGTWTEIRHCGPNLFDQQTGGYTIGPLSHWKFELWFELVLPPHSSIVSCWSLAHVTVCAGASVGPSLIVLFMFLSRNQNQSTSAIVPPWSLFLLRCSR